VISYTALPPSPPFTQVVCGTGIIEPNSYVINAGSDVQGVVTDVFIKEGDQVKKGDPLFKLRDDRLKSERLSLLKDISVAESKIATATMQLEDKTQQRNRFDKLKTGFSVSEDDQQKYRYGVKIAQCQLNEAKESLELSKTKLQALEVSIGLLTVHAPVDGTILKVYVRPGQYIGLLSDCYISLGHLNPLHLRVQIDEYDLHRLSDQKQGKAFLKGDPSVSYPISFVRIEPMAIPKTQLSGLANERVDTRVLEVIYKIEEPYDNLFVGQQLDVFIDVQK
jgi:HlyD family secretion protein